MQKPQPMIKDISLKQNEMRIESQKTILLSELTTI